MIIIFAVKVLSDPSAPTDFIIYREKRPRDVFLSSEDDNNVATMLDMQPPTERYKAISLSSVDKVAER
jgi:hypothetical protein